MAIKWNELNKWSLVWVEFGNPNSDFDVDNQSSYAYGINLGHEFSYRHMAIIVSNPINNDIVWAIPISTYKDNDKNYSTNIILEPNQYSYMIKHKSTIHTDHIRAIDKKLRIKQIIRPYISNTLRGLIRKAINEIIL